MARFALALALSLVSAASFGQNLTAFNVSPPSFRSGGSAVGTVTLGAVAPPNGTFVGMESNNSAAIVPASVLVPAGLTSGSFNVLGANSGYTKLAATLTASKNLLERTFNVVVFPANYSSFVGQTVPTTMIAGHSYSVTLQFKNIGGTTWDTATHHYKLQSYNPVDNTIWGTARMRMVDASVTPQAIGTFTGTVVAPSAAGTYNFQWRCIQDDIYDPFGVPSTNVPISVSAGVDNAQFISQTGIPTGIYVGGKFNPAFTFQNTGNTTWVPGAYTLQSRSPYLNTTWGVNTINLPNSVTPGSLVSLSAQMTAPSTPGTYSFSWFMVHGSGFGQIPPSVNITVAAPDNAQFISQTGVPTSIPTGTTFTPHITYKNTGGSTWLSGSKYWLITEAPRLNTAWGTNRCLLPAGSNVLPTFQATFSPNLTAPSTPGSYFLQWQITNNDQEFGTRTAGVLIQVTSVGNDEDARCISGTVPSTAIAGQHCVASLTFENIGTKAWPLNTEVGVYPALDGTWALPSVKTLSVVAVGANHTYTFDMLAPYLTGTYTLQFRMRDLDKNIWFGQTSPPVNVVVTASPYAQSPWAGGRGGQWSGSGRGYGPSASGILKWKVQMGTGSFAATPVIAADGTVYIGSDGFPNGNALIALDPTNGATKWRFQATDYVFAAAAVGGDGKIYVGSADDNTFNIFAINSDGSLGWKFKAGDRVWSSPMLGHDGTMYIGSSDGNLYAFNPGNGTTKWTHNLGQIIIQTSPVLSPDGTTLYIASYGGQLVALDSGTGAFKWAFTTGSNIWASAAVGLDGTIYIGSWDHKCYAVNPDGTLKWSYLAGDQFHGSPCVGADGTIFVGNDDGYMYALNGTTGGLVWRFQTGRAITAPAALSCDGTLYFGSVDKNFYALDVATGAEKWHITTGSFIESAPAIAADGTVYFASQDGWIYAVK